MESRQYGGTSAPKVSTGTWKLRISSKSTRFSLELYCHVGGLYRTVSEHQTLFLDFEMRPHPHPMLSVITRYWRYTHITVDFPRGMRHGSIRKQRCRSVHIAYPDSRIRKPSAVASPTWACEGFGL